MARTSTRAAKAITHAVVRMYRMGTGDCFVICFYAGKSAKTPSFKMMIDCGAWQGSKEALSEYVTDLTDYVEGEVDVLVVTHEHKDHVYGFDVCADLFPDDFAREVWMAWAENDADRKVKNWKRDYGAKKRALAAAAVAMEQQIATLDLSADLHGARMTEARTRFAETVKAFAQLHVDDRPGNALSAAYIGGLKGMDEVKKRLGKTRDGKEKILYFKPGQVLDNLAGLPGVRIYVLGPPMSWDAIDTEDSKTEGETYEHSRNLSRDTAFALAVNDAGDGSRLSRHSPFESRYDAPPNSCGEAAYRAAENAWRTIDDDWLMTAGSLALRLTSGINNLSLALAIEFVDSGRVMLFPGDAEYGSWASWHEIEWRGHGTATSHEGKHLTEDLLNRTVFYKVAHHLSHNGTARRLGLEMMTHPDLTAMATLDYSNISSGWKNTMPNRFIVGELLERTHGRLMIMNEADLPFDEDSTVTEKIKAARKRLTKRERDALLPYSDYCFEYRVEGGRPH